MVPVQIINSLNRINDTESPIKLTSDSDPFVYKWVYLPFTTNVYSQVAFDLGGGVAVGSVVLIEEDSFGQYAKLFLQYFLAESVMTGQSLFLASAGIHPRNILKDLPQPLLDESHTDQETTDVQLDQMKIAWRYQNQNKFESNPTSVKFGHYYDLTQCMSEELIEKVDTTLVDINQLIDDSQIQDFDEKKEAELSVYEKLLQTIQETIVKGKFGTQDKPEKRNILRIALQSVGSPLWSDLSLSDIKNSYAEMDITLPRFLIALRFLLRSAFAVAMITVPSHIFHDPDFGRRIERLSDTVIQLESFADSKKSGNPLYKDYHGLLNIKQLPKLNSFKCQMPDVTDWAFKVRRKKLVIEKLHLPPDLSVSASRPEDHPAILSSTGMGCSSSGRKNLEF